MVEANRDMAEHFHNRPAVQTTVIALVKPVRDRQADGHYEDVAHFKVPRNGVNSMRDVFDKLS